MSSFAREGDYLAIDRDSAEAGPMNHTTPFLLTESYVRNAGLIADDIGKWCLLDKGGHHVFDTEKLALQTNAMDLSSRMENCHNPSEGPRLPAVYWTCFCPPRQQMTLSFAAP